MVNLFDLVTEKSTKQLIGKGEQVLGEIIEKYMTPNPDKLTDPTAFALNKMAAGVYN